MIVNRMKVLHRHTWVGSFIGSVAVGSRIVMMMGLLKTGQLEEAN